MLNCLATKVSQTNPMLIPNKLLEEAEITHPPVDVDRIAGLLDADIDRQFEFRKAMHSGEIRWNNDRTYPHVWINSTDAEYRQRFTLAHEIGHYFLHMIPNIKNSNSDRFEDGSREFRRSAKLSREETEANYFAACLLMPEVMVRREFGRHIHDCIGCTSNSLNERCQEIIHEMAELFDVSPLAMKHRLKNLSIL